MNFEMRPENRELLDRVAAMIRDEIVPMEAAYHAEIGKGDRWTYTDRQAEILEGLKAKARAALLLPPRHQISIDLKESVVPFLSLSSKSTL